LLQFCFISLRLSQGSDYGAGMKFNLNEDGSKYLRDILGTDMDNTIPHRPLTETATNKLI
jgi:hypothetical protein